MTIDLDDEIAQELLAECREHLATLEADLLAIENGGPEIREERLNRAFRAVHSVKGGAAILGLLKIRDLAHRIEDALSKLRTHKMALAPGEVAVLLRAIDRLRELVHNPGASNEADIAEIADALSRQSALQPASTEKRGAESINQAHQGGMHLRILLVEDDFASRLLLQTFLSRYGECHIAVNGREAVDAFRAALGRGQSYDLICMDIMMPEMDGREAVRQMRALEEARGILSTYGARIIMTTTVDDVKEVIRCFQELCDAYIMKPVDLAKLLSLMRSYQLVP